MTTYIEAESNSYWLSRMTLEDKVDSSESYISLGLCIPVIDNFVILWKTKNTTESKFEALQRLANEEADKFITNNDLFLFFYQDLLAKNIVQYIMEISEDPLCPYRDTLASEEVFEAREAFILLSEIWLEKD